MLGIDVAKSTVEHYMVKRPKPASPTWRAFLAPAVLDGHLADEVANLGVDGRPTTPSAAATSFST